LAGRHPDAVAWLDVSNGAELTFADWDTSSNRLARGLVIRGLRPGERVVIAIAPDQPFAWLTAYTAVHRADAVAVPVNTRLAAPELRAILTHAEASAVLADAAEIAGVPWSELAPRTDARLIGRGIDGCEDEAGWTSLAAHDTSPLEDRRPPVEGDLMDIMYTSGTTGAPKAVAVPYGREDLSEPRASWNGLGFLTASPFPTTSGALLIHGPMRAGMSGCYLPRFEAGTWLSTVEERRPPVAFVVPAMAQLIVAHPRFAEADLSGLAALTIGGAPIAPATLQRLGERLPGADVLVGYGLTEFGAVSRTPNGDRGRHLGSVGQPLPDVEIRVVDDAGLPVPRGEQGEVAVRGADRAREYLEAPAANDGAWRAGWLHTGDLGRLDDDGFLWITGRKKDLIIRGGYNIAPGEVEDVLYSHPDVVEAAVAGIPHDVLGEDVGAWVVLRDGSACSPDDLSRHLRASLADFKVPRQVHVVTSLPRNAAGKVVTRELVDYDTRAPAEGG
jgi:acyl-CoA synthetase (AMP-forming)/AMP-acid ligase II